jgi:hypothetical protein
VPRPRSGHRIICDDDHNIYSFGGFNPITPQISEGTADESGWDTNKPLFRDLWKFDNVTRSWNKVKTVGTHPEQLASHSATYFRDHLIVYGGTGVPFGQSSSNKIHACNLKTGVWEYMRPQNTDDSQIPSDQYGQAVVVDNESCCLYAIGGTTGFRYTIDVYKFNLFTRRWTLLWKRSDSDHNQFPEERYRHEIVLYNNQIFVFGGGTASNCYGFKYIPVFDLKTKSWIKLKSNPKSSKSAIPAARKCHGCVKTSTNQVFIMGGSDGELIFKDIWKFDLTSSTWTKMAIEMPSPLYFHGMTISPVGKVTIFGGVYRIMANQMDTNVRTNDLHEVWLEIPPLEELAWNAVVSSIDSGKLRSCSRSQLAELGIPSKIINRLNFNHAVAVRSPAKSVTSEEVLMPEPS